MVSASLPSKRKWILPTLFRIKTNADCLAYIVKKGSIAIDGISLTVIDVLEDSFTVSLIPAYTRYDYVGI
jgi:riboflavin synthase